MPVDLADSCQALKMRHLVGAVPGLAERARAEGWTYEEFLAACLEQEVGARRSNDSEARIRCAGFPVRKTLDEYRDDHSPLNREVIAQLGTLVFVEARQNVVLLGPPGSGKTHLAIGLSIRACEAGYRVAFATAAEWVERLTLARSQDRLHEELRRLGQYHVIVIDELGYLPFQAEGAGLLFQLVSGRYERASLIVTSNVAFTRWPELFGDATIATGVRIRLLHHAQVVSLERSDRLDEGGPEDLPFDDNPLAPGGPYDFQTPEGEWDYMAWDRPDGLTNLVGSKRAELAKDRHFQTGFQP